MTKQIQDGRADFDFIYGKWRMHNRRLRARLKNCADWEEFEGHSVVRPTLDGMGNIDEVTMHRESGPMQGLTVRLFDAASKQWRIYWGTALTGSMDNPMIGEFKNGRGEFFTQELFEGRAIISRFVWLTPSPTTAHWEQAFSTDGGATWETNWTMDMTREE